MVAGKVLILANLAAAWYGGQFGGGAFGGGQASPMNESLYDDINNYHFGYCGSRTHTASFGRAEHNDSHV